MPRANQGLVGGDQPVESGALDPCARQPVFSAGEGTIGVWVKRDVLVPSPVTYAIVRPQDCYLIK